MLQQLPGVWPPLVPGASLGMSLPTCLVGVAVSNTPHSPVLLEKAAPSFRRPWPSWKELLEPRWQEGGGITECIFWWGAAGLAALCTQGFLVQCLGEGSEGVEMHLASGVCKCGRWLEASPSPRPHWLLLAPGGAPGRMETIQLLLLSRNTWDQSLMSMYHLFMYLACFRLCCDGSPDHYLILIFESMMYVDTPTALRDFAARLETCLGN